MIERAANAFWNLAGFHEEFPRNLQEPVAWALPLAVVLTPTLWLHDVVSWAVRNGVVVNHPGADRRLRGCLVAAKGKGVIFIDGTDEERERIYTLAHETSHFLLEHYLPRAKMVELYGPVITQVLDGERPATLEERLAGVLLGQSLYPDVHCMDRDDQGLFSSERTRLIECHADQLAIELLAPESAVLDSCRRRACISREGIGQVLVSGFGLPSRIARDYSAELARRWGGEPSFRSWLTGSEDFVEL
jgi:hypothetical protein